MPTTRTTWETLDSGLSVATDARHTLIIPRAYAHIFMLPKPLFEAASAVPHEWPLPLPRPGKAALQTLSGTLAAILRYAEAHADYRLLIAGHARAVHPKEHGMVCASNRALAVHALLIGDRDEFAKACAVHTARDEERLLRFMAQVLDYPCGLPEGEVTRKRRIRAWRAFRAHHRERHGVPLPAEPSASEKDLGVLFDVYEQRLANALDTDVAGLSEYRTKLRFLNPAAYACGDFWSVSPSGVERVDLFFFEPPEEVPDYAGDYDKRRWKPGTSLYHGERYVRRFPERLAPEPSAICVRMTGMYFDTDKCFLLPSAMSGMRKLVSLYKDHPRGEVLIVGHRDKAGETDYNDKLSLERAKAIAAYLTDDLEGWLAWYGKEVPEKKRWGMVEDNLMLSALPDASVHASAKNRLKSYQESRGLEPDGIAGPKTRRQLVLDYMALDGTSLPAGLTPVAHGCGEHFPRSLASDGESDAQDRRVELFLFPDGVKPAPPGDNSAAGSTEYLRWRSAVIYEEVLARRVVGEFESSFALRDPHHG